MRNIVPILLFGFFCDDECGYSWDLVRIGIRLSTQNHNRLLFRMILHAGKLGLECTHCHTSVEKSRFATVPAMSVCMSCHENAQIESPELDKLKLILVE